MARRIEDVAWAAGLFEGEGAVMIARTNGNPARKSYFLQLVVAMTDEEPVRWLAETWGGSLHRQHVVKHWRPSLRWVTSGNDAAAFLRDIEPFVKSDRLRRKVELALAFQAQKQRFGRGKPAPEEYHTRQYDFWERMRRLNLKGALTLDVDERASVVAVARSALA